MTQKSFQDYYPDHLSHCYGRGRLNEFGLQIKSYWGGFDTELKKAKSDLRSGICQA